MKISTLLVVFLATAWSSLAQHPTCDGNRYLNPISTVDQTNAIVYGNATTYGGNNSDLYLDFFEPAGDVAASRPLIILAFGGSFVAGAREDMHDYCNYYAARGYACATIDYRLYDGPFFPFPDSVTMTDEVLKALSDMKAAIRFFKEDAATANTYRVDPDYIFVGGISAGGIVASHAAMLDSTDAIEPYIVPLLANNGGWTGNSSSNTQYDDAVRGVLNFSGALRSASYIDANDPPLFAVHDEMDGVVPYASGFASIGPVPIIRLEGSYLMYQKAQAEGLTSELITYPNSNGHVSYFSDQAATDSILTRSLNFLYPQVCGAPLGIENVTTSVEFEMYPNPAQSSVTLSIEDGSGFLFSMIDLAGRTILSENAQLGKKVVSVSGFTPGVYIVEVINQQTGKSARKQLVIN